MYSFPFFLGWEIGRSSTDCGWFMHLMKIVVGWKASLSFTLRAGCIALKGDESGWEALQDSWRCFMFGDKVTTELPNFSLTFCKQPFSWHDKNKLCFLSSKWSPKYGVFHTLPGMQIKWAYSYGLNIVIFIDFILALLLAILIFAFDIPILFFFFGKYFLLWNMWNTITLWLIDYIL